MHETENLRTIRAFELLEESIIKLANPRKYLRALASRLAYIRKRQDKLPSTAPQQGFLECESNALFWLMAQFAASRNYDVRTVLLEQTKDGLPDVKRFDQISAALEFARKHALKKPNGVKEESAADLSQA